MFGFGSFVFGVDLGFGFFEVLVYYAFFLFLICGCGLVFWLLFYLF